MTKERYFYVAPVLIAVSQLVWSEAGVNRFGDPNYSMPITLPNAPVAGISPKLSLHYNGTMDNGMLGVAWEIQGLEDSIEPCMRTLSQTGTIRAVKYDREDQYCLNGERLVLTSGEHGNNGAEYALESDKFSKVVIFAEAEGQPNSFILTTKNGVVKSYGNTADSKINIKGTQDVRKWNLSKVEKDSSEYTISYVIDASTGGYSISSFSYPNEAGETVLASFTYEARGDSVDRFAKGVAYSDRVKRLKKLSVSESGSEISSYTFEYEGAWVSELSRLTKITQCENGACLPSVVVNWSSSQLDFNLVNRSFPVGAPNRESPYTNCTVERTPNKRMHDFNGDGLKDYIYIPPVSSNQYAANYTQGDSLQAKIFLQQVDGSWVEEIWPSQLMTVPTSLQFLDVNGDGKTDIVGHLAVPTSGNNPKDLEVELSTGSGFVKSVWASEVAPTETIYNGEVSNKTPGRIDYEYHDVDGDKLPELLAIIFYSHKYSVYSPGSHRYVTHYTQRRDIYIRKNLGDRFGEKIKWVSDVENYEKVSDLNKDGLLDVVAKNVILYGNHDLSLTEYSSEHVLGELTDVNGDGYVDIARGSKNYSSYAYLNNGVNFGSARVIQEPHAYITLPDDQVLLPQNVDFNLDGSTDYIWKHLQNTTGRSSVNISVAGNSDSGYLASGGFSFGSSSRSRFSTYSESLDINGDGRADHIAHESWACYKPYYWTWQGSVYGDGNSTTIAYNTTKPLNHLTTIESDGSVLAEYKYQSIVDPSINTPASDAQFPIKDVKSGKIVVSEISYLDDADQTQTVSYTYLGMKEDLHGRGNLGFAEITSLNTVSDKKETTRYAQSFPLLGKMVSKDVVKASEDFLVEKQEMEYEVVGDASSEPVFAYVKSKTVNTYSLLDGGVLNTSVTENTIDNAGNVSEVEDDIAAPVNEQACPRPVDV